MEEHVLSTRRTARYYAFSPAGEVQEVWFVLHGYGQLAAPFLRLFESIRQPHRVIIAPEALSRFYLENHSRVGASWMTREDRLAEIQDTQVYLDSLYEEVFKTYDRENVKVHVLGFSQGTATASRWVTQGTSHADRLILWGGLLAHDLNLEAHHEALGHLNLTFVVGDQDPYVTPEKLVEQETLLIEKGIPYRLRPFKGGHDILPHVLDTLIGR